MKINSKFFVLMIIALLFQNISVYKSTTASAKGVFEFYVSTEGNDKGDGSIENPFKTPERARDEVRKISGSDVTVYFRGGSYYLDKGFILNAADSKNTKVTYKAYNGENVVFTGGVDINTDDFTQVSDSNILNRIPSEARGYVKQFDLKSVGITEYGSLPYTGHSMVYVRPFVKGCGKSDSDIELFYDGEMLSLSRWPDNDFATVSKVINKGDILRNWAKDKQGSKDYVPENERNNPPVGFTIGINDNRVKRWKTADDAWMFGYWFYNWSDQSVRIKDIDASGNAVISREPSAYGVRAGQRFYVYNLIEEMDTTGEWYLDRNTGILYMYPPVIKNGEKNVTVSLLKDDMIKIDGAKNIFFEDIEFSTGLRNGVNIRNSENIAFKNCVIENMNYSGFCVSSSYNSGIQDSKVYNTGRSGIEIGGGIIETLTPGNNFARRNDIHDFSKIQTTYTPGIKVSGVGNVISYNKIHDGPATVLLFSGNDNIIENNEIYDSGYASDDMGAIYSGRSWMKRGNVIRNNYFHDLKGYANGTHKYSAIYLDDCMSGTIIENNIFENCSQGVFINGGRDNRVSDNLFVNVTNVMRGTDLSIATWANSWGTLEGELKNSPFYKSELWKNRYPGLYNILEDDPRLPKNNIIKNNKVINSQLIMGDKGIMPTFEKNSIVEIEKTNANLDISVFGSDKMIKVLSQKEGAQGENVILRVTDENDNIVAFDEYKRDANGVINADVYLMNDVNDGKFRVYLMGQTSDKPDTGIFFLNSGASDLKLETFSAKNINNEYVDSIYGEKGIEVSAKVRNYSGEAKNPVMISACYDENGKIIKIESVSGQVQAGEMLDMKLFMVLPDFYKKAEVRTFFMDSFENIRPVSENVTLK